MPNLTRRVDFAARFEALSLPILTFARVAARDLFRSRQGGTGPRTHLEEAASWLERAHDASPDDGVSYGFSLRGGWRPSYPETSGYIASTFYDLAAAGFEAELRARAEEIARWLCRMQNPDGGIANPAFDPDRGIVFDTGQVLLGLTRAARETGDETFTEAARKAGDWLCEVADEEGRWTRNTHNGIPHVYNTRVAWALLGLNALSPGEDYERVARANLDWALTCERDGWFDQCAFQTGVPAFTHTIAYAIRGLIEAWVLLPEQRYLDTALRAAKAVAAHVRADGFLPGTFDARGNPRASYCCLTGNCQLAIAWGKLYGETGDEELKRAASDALSFVLQHQDLATSNPGTRGAIKGSQPVWGGYSPFTYPNWATKFFVDAMLLCSGWLG